MSELSSEVQYRVLTLIERNPEMSQRELAREMGVSLGKANYCLQALIHRGWIKVRNFRNSRRKSAYLYLLTPRGFREKARVTFVFLRQRVEEFEKLQSEIAELRKDSERV